MFNDGIWTVVCFINTNSTFFFEDILALLLSDVLLFLQEKDQKYIFAAVVSILPCDAYFKWFNPTSPWKNAWNSYWHYIVIGKNVPCSIPIEISDCSV